ncbi:hypothetical protein EAI_13683 [Harpegnathos saltator]|uniref:Uncharacterized protein n=1 Tax=Harpegnathos saltator TaxID=610380 RepID=E2C0X8_HARSA|nr:hypothetical protein EAI_13683 [Harpegnathos saltator]
MQLATSQRPHPPPVPPRPSRQVVAEALKRSPRPPCPIRQAPPPPPNTKPWRSNQQQQQQQPQQQQQQQQVSPTGGRTIVYESTKECLKDSKDESVFNDKKQQDHRKQNASINRNAEDNCSENPTADRRRSSDGKVLASSHDHQQQQHEGSSISEKSQAFYSVGNLAGNVLRKRDSLTEEQRPRRPSEIRRNSRGKDQVHPADHRTWYKDSAGIEQRKEDAVVPTEKVEMAVVSSRDRLEATSRPPPPPPVAARTNVSFEDECRASSGPDFAGGQVAVSHSEKCSPEREANGHDARSTPTCRLCPGEQQQQQQEASLASEKAIRNSAEVAIERSGGGDIPNVDRAATVLVVDGDEAERKIALDDDDDNNDNDSDNNIHRQDWLEAGIRYSSTQITLHGDGDGDGVGDEDRVNGYDHREEERITDLDFIR